MTDLLSTTETPSDAELISRVRGGDAAAYGELFSRHVDAARRLSRQLVRGPDADDLVSDAFAKVLQVLQGGGGPDVAFRAYLLTAVRRLHVDRVRAGSRLQTSDDMTQFDPGVPFQDTAVASFENGAAARAFASLPERWQLVLWHLEVEGQKPAEIAPLLGMSANSVSALAYRAREGLRQAFLTMHLADISGDQCRWVNEHLGGFVRKGLSKRDTGKVDDHLRECRRCTAMYLELTEVNSNLRGIIAPLLLGGAAAGYLSSTGGAGLGGVMALVGRVRDVVVANSTAATVGAVAAGVATVATAGIVIANTNGSEVVVDADRPITVTTPVVPRVAPSASATATGHPSPSAPAHASPRVTVPVQPSGTSTGDATTPAEDAGSATAPGSSDPGAAAPGSSGDEVSVVPIGGDLHGPGEPVGSPLADQPTKPDKPSAGPTPGNQGPGGGSTPGDGGRPGGDTGSRGDTGSQPGGTGTSPGDKGPGGPGSVPGGDPSTGGGTTTDPGGGTTTDPGGTNPGGSQTDSPGGSTPPPSASPTTDPTDTPTATQTPSPTETPTQPSSFTVNWSDAGSVSDQGGNQYDIPFHVDGVSLSGTMQIALSAVASQNGDEKTENNKYEIVDIKGSESAFSCAAVDENSSVFSCSGVPSSTDVVVTVKLPASGTATLTVSDPSGASSTIQFDFPLDPSPSDTPTDTITPEDGSSGNNGHGEKGNEHSSLMERLFAPLTRFLPL